jgi:hypothetical protein
MGTFNLNIPRQRISRAKKTKKWGKAVIDDLERLSETDTYNGRSTRYKKQVNYDLYNGRFDIEDFEYVVNPYGFKENEFPASLQHYDAISPKINLLLGEEIKRPFNFRSVSINQEAISQMEEARKEMIVSTHMEYIQALVQGQDPQEAEEKLAGLEKYLKYSHSDIIERTSNHILKYLMREESLEYKFNEGFKDALIAGEEIYWTGIISGEPRCRVCNPLDITVISDPDSDFIEDAIAVLEERWMTVPSIIDEFYQSPDFTDKVAKDLEVKYNNPGNYGDDQIEYNSVDIIIKGDDESRHKDGLKKRSHDGDGSIRVLRCEWKSQRKVGFLYIMDQGQEVVELVDESFELPEEATKDNDGYYHFDDMRLKWYWISEYWEGTKIGDDIYIDIKPKQNQRRDLDNPSICKSGYVGLIYNARNSESISLVDRMKPYQYLYNISFYRLELGMAKDKGKVALMDVSQIPASEGWDVDKWMYYLDAMSIMFINSQEEGKRGQQSNFNQFQSIDLSMGNYINTHVQMLDQIEHKLGELSGVSRQRMGQVQTSELVGNVERSISQSSAITEYWFYQHNEVKRRVLESMLDVARIAWRKGKKVNFVTDDLGRQMINVGDEFSNNQYGVFVGNTAKDNKNLAEAKSLLQAAIQGDKIKLSEAVAVLNSDSLVDIRKELEQGEDMAEQRRQQMEQQAQQSQERMAQQAAQMEQEKIAFDREKNIRDNETKLQVAYINQEGRNDEGGYEDNSMEQAKLSNDKYKHDTELSFKREQLAQQREKDKNDHFLKKEEIKVKKIAANKKPSGGGSK